MPAVRVLVATCTGNANWVLPLGAIAAVVAAYALGFWHGNEKS